MKYYFLVQFKRIARLLKEAGLNPIFGIGLSIVTFLILSYFFFQKIKYPEYIYPVIAFYFINYLGNSERNNFLKNCFSKRDYLKIKSIENFLVASPFALFLLFENEFISALSVYILAFLSVFLVKINPFSRSLPTPFYKYPFEFIIGFRNSYYIIILIYALAFFSIYYSNLNLGLFSLLAPYLIISFFYYSQPEPIFYVWLNSSKSSGFLVDKLKIAVIYSLMMSLPIAGLLVLFHFDHWFIILLIEITGVLFVVTSLLGKYAYYPSEINLIQGFAIGFSLLFPPLLLALIPFLFSKAKQNLKSILR